MTRDEQVPLDDGRTAPSWAFDRPATVVAGSNPGIVNPYGGGKDISMSARGYIPWGETRPTSEEHDVPAAHPVDLTNGGRGLVVDLFAGPGGWSQGIRHLGIADIGIEWNEQACKTRRAAGHATIRADVSTVATGPFKGKVWGLIMSPPCQAFSMAGKRKGQPTAFLDALRGEYDPVAIRADIAAQQQARADWESRWRAVADERGWWEDPSEDSTQTRIALPGDELGFEDDRDSYDPDAVTDMGPAPGTGRRLKPGGARERDAEFGPEPEVDDERGMFMAEAIRWIDELCADGDGPEWICAEQVPPAAWMWQAALPWLRERGYSCWAGVLNAADFGVPQTRKRAILMASRTRTVQPPVPTHCEGGSDGDLFGDSLLPWVSMASALGWVATGDGPKVEYRRGGDRIHEGFDPITEPSDTLTSRADRWQPKDVARVKTNASMRPDGRTTEFDAQERPAPTFTGWSGLQWEMPAAAVGGDTARGVRVWEDPALDSAAGRAEAPAGPVPAVALANGNQENAAVRRADEPAGTLFFGKRLNAVGWVDAGRADAAGPTPTASMIRISVPEAAVLQSFPPSYPFAGPKSAQFLQIGDAVPPRLGWHVVHALVG